MKRKDAIRVLHKGGLELPAGYKFDREEANARRGRPDLTASTLITYQVKNAKQDESPIVTDNRTHP